MNKNEVISYILIFSLGIIISYAVFSFTERNFPKDIVLQSTGYFDNINSDSVIYVSDFKLYELVNSSSMLPTIFPHSKSLVREDVEDFNIGDIILINLNYEGEYKDLPSGHRIVDIGKKDGKICYITKGDNLKYKDTGCRTSDEISGKIVGVLY